MTKIKVEIESLWNFLFLVLFINNAMNEKFIIFMEEQKAYNIYYIRHYIDDFIELILTF